MSVSTKFHYCPSVDLSIDTKTEEGSDIWSQFKEIDLFWLVGISLEEQVPAVVSCSSWDATQKNRSIDGRFFFSFDFDGDPSYKYHFSPYLLLTYSQIALSLSAYLRSRSLNNIWSRFFLLLCSPSSFDGCRMNKFFGCTLCSVCDMTSDYFYRSPSYPRIFPFPIFCYLEKEEKRMMTSMMKKRRMKRRNSVRVVRARNKSLHLSPFLNIRSHDVRKTTRHGEIFVIVKATIQQSNWVPFWCRRISN